MMDGSIIGGSLLKEGPKAFHYGKDENNFYLYYRWLSNKAQVGLQYVIGTLTLECVQVKSIVHFDILALVVYCSKLAVTLARITITSLLSILIRSKCKVFSWSSASTCTLLKSTFTLEFFCASVAFCLFLVQIKI